MIDLTNIDYMLSLNRLTPMVAIFLTLIALFSKKYITRDYVSSSIMHLTILLWTMLIWADWGSEVFRPSRQTIVARCLMVVILGLVVLLIRNYSKIFRRMKFNNQALSDEKNRLKQLLQDQLNQDKPNKNHTAK
nr:hypothetical protein [Moraxella sp. CTOTU48268]